ncbi:hypothetical protein BD289DRAFT_184764 [Coniella lustricola]|uniref:Uncharacterized protein n=1 Tax=Coniella lustricola TaxID=2025994 RepID=A0A2T2ZT69_9PEZI|nr:hypothetical protein BD289DRAFT_184764 [Coniella lustricola]
MHGTECLWQADSGLQDYHESSADTAISKSVTPSAQAHYQPVEDTAAFDNHFSTVRLPASSEKDDTPRVSVSQPLLALPNPTSTIISGNATRTGTIAANNISKPLTTLLHAAAPCTSTSLAPQPAVPAAEHGMNTDPEPEPEPEPGQERDIEDQVLLLLDAL